MMIKSLKLFCASFFRPIHAILLRHWYINKNSWARVFDTFYWPCMEILVWGFLSTFIAAQMTGTSIKQDLLGLFITANILWAALFRSSINFTFCLLEEYWARNVGNLYMSPLKSIQHIIAMSIFAFLRLTAGLASAILLTYLVFGYNVLSIGFDFFILYVLNFLFGLSIGLFVSGLLLRYGLAAERLTWVVSFGMYPLTCVYYPLSVMPEPLFTISSLLPGTYIFENLRYVFEASSLDMIILTKGIIALIGCLLFSLWFYKRMFRLANEHGLLLNTGD